MKILTRYILRNFGAEFATYFSVISLLFVLDYIYKLLPVLMSHQADPVTIVKLFLFILPSVIMLAIPITFLLALLLTYGYMREYGELTIMSTMGTRRRTYTAPAVVTAVVVSVFMMFFSGVIAPESQKLFRKTLEDFLSNAPSLALTNNSFQKFGCRSVYVSKTSDGEISGIYIYNRTDDVSVQTISAQKARASVDINDNLVLQLEDGRLSNFSFSDPEAETSVQFKRHTVILPRSTAVKKPFAQDQLRELTNAELWAYSRDPKRSPAEFSSAGIELGSRISGSLAILCFAFLGPLIGQTMRKNAKSVSFVYTVLIVGSYYFLLMGCMSVGERVEAVRHDLGRIIAVLLVPNLALAVSYFILRNRIKE